MSGATQLSGRSSASRLITAAETMPASQPTTMTFTSHSSRLSSHTRRSTGSHDSYRRRAIRAVVKGERGGSDAPGWAGPS